MIEPFVPRVGGILSADIAVPEHERELRFYARVLGTGDKPRWRDDLRNDLGMPIIGLGERVPAYELLPLQWMPHIQVADVAASVERALALGGEKLMYAADDEGAGLWAVLLDPNGAAFGIIPVVAPEHISLGDGSPSPEAVNRAGRITCIDLTVADATATRDFYRQVVGWSSKDVELEDEAGHCSDYAMLAADGTPTARIRHARGKNQDLPPAWMIVLPVGDLAESLERVRAEGGTVIKATSELDGEHAYATIQDPVGACLALVPGL